jgi:hypothetical protein
VVKKVKPAKRRARPDWGDDPPPPPRKRVDIAKWMRARAARLSICAEFSKLADSHGEAVAHFLHPRRIEKSERRELDKLTTLLRLLDGPPDMSIGQLAKAQVVERGTAEDHPGYTNQWRARENLIREWVRQYNRDVELHQL